MWKPVQWLFWDTHDLSRTGYAKRNRHLDMYQVANCWVKKRDFDARIERTWNKPSPVIPYLTLQKWWDELSKVWEKADKLQVQDVIDFQTTFSHIRAAYFKLPNSSLDWWYVELQSWCRACKSATLDAAVDEPDRILLKPKGHRFYNV
jgi:hypothetical protein